MILFRTPTQFALVAMVAGGFVNASAAEYVSNNGNFESSFYGAGVPVFWKANAGDGNANLRDTIHLSPFSNVYPSGGQSVVLMDGASDSNFPNLLSYAAPSQSLYMFSFEFSVDAVLDGPWKLQIGGDSGGFNFAFLIGVSNQLQFAGGTASSILSLTPGAWYQVNAMVNDNTGAISGTATPYGALPIAFSGALIPGGPLRSSFIEILDASPNQNATLYLDNISIRTVPEPCCPAIFILGLVLFRHKARGFSKI